MITKETGHFKWVDEQPTMVIIQNERMRTPVIYKLVEVNADEIAELIDEKKKS